MNKVTIEEFKQFYNNEILPFIKPYETKREVFNKKSAPLKNMVITIFVILLAGFIITILSTVLKTFSYIMNPQANPTDLFQSAFVPGIAPVFIIGAIITMAIFGLLTNCKHKNIKKELKHGLLSKIFSYCNSKISTTNSEQITLQELKQTSLPIYTKTDDDTICGSYKGVKFVINEAYVQLPIKAKTPTALFRVLILKLEMNKKFSGQTIVVPNYINYNHKNNNEVFLEDINFMKLNNIYATDQIEALYLLTPTFMERIKSLGKIFAQKALASPTMPVQYKYFIQKNPTCITAFSNNYVYILANTTIDNFDIPLEKNLYDINIYYNIYLQLVELLSTIDSLKLNEKTGL